MGLFDADLWPRSRQALRCLSTSSSASPSSEKSDSRKPTKDAPATSGAKPPGAKKTKKSIDPIREIEQELEAETDRKVKNVRNGARSEIARSIADPKPPKGPKIPVQLKEPLELTTPNFKAVSLRKKGKFDEAAQMLEELLAKRDSTLGPEDPMTISAMNELAVTYSELDRHAEAIVLFRKVLKSILKLHGVRKSLSTRKALARELMLSSKKDIEEATSLLEDLLVDMERKFTAEHAETIDTRQTLAIALRMQGKTDDATQLLESQDQDEDGAAFPT